MNNEAVAFRQEYERLKSIAQAAPAPAPKRRKHYHLTASETVRRDEMTAAGDSVKLIAYRLGVTVHAIYNVRYRKAKKAKNVAD